MKLGHEQGNGFTERSVTTSWGHREVIHKLLGVIKRSVCSLESGKWFLGEILEGR